MATGRQDGNDRSVLDDLLAEKGSLGPNFVHSNKLLDQGILNNQLSTIAVENSLNTCVLGILYVTCTRLYVDSSYYKFHI